MSQSEKGEPGGFAKWMLDFLGKSDLDWLLEGQLEDEQQNEMDQEVPETQSTDDAKSDVKGKSDGG